MNKVPKLNLKKNNNFLFIVVLLAFFSSITAFSQTENAGVSSEETLMNSNNVVIENPSKVSASVMNSNVNFILWFMGTKGDMGGTFSNGDMYSKKSFMTSGREPNRLLVKTLLKKALNIKSC